MGNWICSSVREKWKWFYSAYFESLYFKEANQWRRYRKIPGRTRREKYEPTEEVYHTLHHSARRLATVYQQPTWIVKEHAHFWNYEEPNYDPINFDPYKESFLYIETAFDASLSSPRILIDEIILPEDSCAAIAEAIRNGKARIVSDGSYFPEEEAGGSAFIITAGKKIKRI